MKVCCLRISGVFSFKGLAHVYGICFHFMEHFRVWLLCAVCKLGFLIPFGFGVVAVISVNLP